MDTVIVNKTHYKGNIVCFFSKTVWYYVLNWFNIQHFYNIWLQTYEFVKPHALLIGQ